jgi:hypothetical protein
MAYRFGFCQVRISVGRGVEFASEEECLVSCIDVVATTICCVGGLGVMIMSEDDCLRSWVDISAVFELWRGRGDGHGSGPPLPGLNT